MQDSVKEEGKMESEVCKPDFRKLIDEAVEGDKAALETLLCRIQDKVFNLSLRMLGMVSDAEDASQEILIRVMTNLSSFQKRSSFETWVYRLAVNYLINYKKSMFAQHPLDFEFYGNDIKYAGTDEAEALVDDLTREKLAEELKLSCTNVMLQCLDAKSRCIFILGTMFRVDSRAAAEIFDMTPENYRQRLKRTRRKMADFLGSHCGLTATGACNCIKRVDYAISQKRINPKKPEFLSLKPLDNKVLQDCREEMERLDELAVTFEDFPEYRATFSAQQMVQVLLKSAPLQKIQQF